MMAGTPLARAGRKGCHMHFALGHLIAALPLGQAAGHWLDPLIERLARYFPERTFFSYEFNVRAMLALLLVGLCCGAVSSLVVAGRMAFFSDALAHCAFAGVSIGFLAFEYLPGA